MRTVLLLLVVVLLASAQKKDDVSAKTLDEIEAEHVDNMETLKAIEKEQEKELKKKDEKVDEKKVDEKKKTEIKRGPAAAFLYSVRQRLAALHLQLSIDFRALSACKSAACRAAARARIRDVKRAELLVRRARGHIRLGRIFRDAARCTNSHCRRRLRREVRKEQEDMRALIRRGANERAREAKEAAARLAHRATVAAAHADHARKIAFHLNHHEKKRRADRFMHLARHFHGLGMLYAKAASCLSHKCERKYLRKIKVFRAEQKRALERLRTEGVLAALKRSREAASELALHPRLPNRLERLSDEWNDIDDVDEVYKADHVTRAMKEETKLMVAKARKALERARESPESDRAYEAAEKEIKKAEKFEKAVKASAEGPAEPVFVMSVPEALEEEPSHLTDPKVAQAVKLSAKLQKIAEQEIQKLEEKAAVADDSVTKLAVQKEIEMDTKLAKDFSLGAKCEGEKCVKAVVAEVKADRAQGEKAIQEAKQAQML